MIGSPDPVEALRWTLQDWRETDNDTKKKLICLISSETWEGDDKIHAARALAWAYKTTPVDIFRGYEAAYWTKYAKVLPRWLKICVSTKPEVDFIFKTCVLPGKDKNQNIPLDREKCIIDLISRGDDLDPFFFPPRTNVLDKEGELHLRFLITWFIRRYDLKTAAGLLQQLKKHRPQAKSETAPPAIRSRSGGASQCLFLVIPLLLAATLLLPFLFRDTYRFFLPLIYLSLPAGVLWLLTNPLANLAIGLLVPRLAGCIIVGYLPLVVGIETWQAIGYLAKTPYSWQLYVLIVIAGLAALGYLIVEMQHINLGKREVILRSLKVYTLGLSWSLGIGLVMLDLLALAYQKMDENKFLCETQLTWLPGLLGKIPWEILVGYVPLALLIGIFLQIIWEEKPITEPL